MSALTEYVPGPRLGALQRPWGWVSYAQKRKLRHREADTVQGNWGMTLCLSGSKVYVVPLFWVPATSI